MTELETLISRSLRRFVRDINLHRWTGRREREAISLYVLGYLKDEVRRGRPISGITQIGIEVPVRQIAPGKMKRLSRRRGVKEHVAKDLVIWPRPRMTCWSDSGALGQPPITILEWTFGAPRPKSFDVEWLEEYSRTRPRFVGFAIALFRIGRGFRLIGTKVRRGKSQEEWLVLDNRQAP